MTFQHVGKNTGHGKEHRGTYRILSARNHCKADTWQMTTLGKEAAKYDVLLPSMRASVVHQYEACILSTLARFRSVNQSCVQHFPLGSDWPPLNLDLEPRTADSAFFRQANEAGT